jgi:hypothetical protein
MASEKRLVRRRCNCFAGRTDLLLLIRAEVCWSNVDLNLVERTRKREGGFIEVAHRCSVPSTQLSVLSHDYGGRT